MTRSKTELIRSITGPEVIYNSGSFPRYHQWEFGSGFNVVSDPSGKRLKIQISPDFTDWSDSPALHDVDMNGYTITNLSTSLDNPSGSVNVQTMNQQIDVMATDLVTYVNNVFTGLEQATLNRITSSHHSTNTHYSGTLNCSGVFSDEMSVEKNGEMFTFSQSVFAMSTTESDRMEFVLDVENAINSVPLYDWSDAQWSGAYVVVSAMYPGSGPSFLNITTTAFGETFVEAATNKIRFIVDAPASSGIEVAWILKIPRVLVT